MTELLTLLQFDKPQWLIAIPVSAILLGMLLWKVPQLLGNWQRLSEKGRNYTYYFPNRALLETGRPGNQQKNKYVIFLLQYTRYFLLLTLIFIALAQPYKKGQQLPDPPSYHDIVFLVDTSITMALKDYQIDGQRIERMSMLKKVLEHFIHALDGSRIGINVFSEKVYTLSPLTTDYDLLGKQLNRLESAVLTGRTSNPSQAMLFTSRQYQHSATKPALVMLTDINRPDRKIDPRVAAEYLSTQGFHLHIIGIGAGSQQAENTEDISGLIYQPANFRLLEEIAVAGKGQFYWTKDLNSLNDALDNIRQTEKRQVELKPEFIKLPLYSWFVGLALLWITFWQILPFLRVVV
ncbi:MAG: VWA domain-containing protein [Gammaproteobacteria bacterium]